MKTIAMMNMKGGVGKTTLAFNLAYDAAHTGCFRVLMIDLDPQANLSQYAMGGTGYQRFLDGDGMSVLDVLRGQVSAREAHRKLECTTERDYTGGDPGPILKRDEWDDGSYLHLIPARLELAGLVKRGEIDPEILESFVRGLHLHYDAVFVDCPPTDSLLTDITYHTVRQVIVPVRPEYLATIGLPLLAGSIHGFNTENPRRKVEVGGIVFNGVRAGNVPSQQVRAMQDVRKIARKHGWHVFRQEVRYSDSFPAGSSFGTPIGLTHNVRTYVRKEFDKFYRQFEKRILKQP